MPAIKDPVTYRLIRIILAGLYDDMKQAYRALYQKFGDKADAAARFLWEKRREKPFDALGHDEVPKKIIDNMFNQTASDLASHLALQQFVEEGRTTDTKSELFDDDYYKQVWKIFFNSIKEGKTGSPVINTSLITNFLNFFQEEKKHYVSPETGFADFMENKSLPKKELQRIGNLFKTKSIISDELYNEINVSYKAVMYTNFLQRRGILLKKMTPGPGWEDIKCASEYIFLPKQLRVLEKYLEAL